MINAAERELAAVGIGALVVLADASYWHHVQMEPLVNRGKQVLISPEAGKRKGTRPDGGLYSFMRRCPYSERGGSLYAKRAKA
jgi:hypothetical protein